MTNDRDDPTQQVDFTLNQLVGMANHFGISVGVTLAVNGIVVTGTLIAAHEWFRQYGRMFGEALERAAPGAGSTVAKGFGEFGDKLKAQTTQREELTAVDAESEAVQYRYVHLKSARYVTATVLLPGDGAGMLWRGRLVDVSGWSLGEFARYPAT